jgi:glucose/arabinose dehydrogenase
MAQFFSLFLIGGLVVFICSLTIFAQGFKGITDIKIGPDGYLYILTYERPGGEGAIYRIIPRNV